jgi:integrase
MSDARIRQRQPGVAKRVWGYYWGYRVESAAEYHGNPPLSAVRSTDTLSANRLSGIFPHAPNSSKPTLGEAAMIVQRRPALSGPDFDQEWGIGGGRIEDGGIIPPMLTDAQVKRVKPKDKPYKLSDAGGLFLYVAPTGNLSWRLKYRFAGKEKLLTFGGYPHVSLAKARAKRDDAKRLLRDGIDPGAKEASVDGPTFEAVARDWFERNKGRWAPRHADDVIGSLERDIFPTLGGKPIRSITAAMVLKALQPIEDRPAIETAKRIRQRMSSVFVFAISSDLAENDPAAVVKGALRPMLKKGKQPAITDLEQARAMLRQIEATPSSPVTRMGNRLLALTNVRPGELRGVAWTEFEALESDTPIWRIPAARMKLALHKKDEAAHDHIVPLSRQAVELIEEIRPLTGRSAFVFPNDRHSHKPMSENAIGYLINRAGYYGRHVPHGWRATFSTAMNDRAEREGRSSDRAVIDLMLAHVPANKVEGAYNRAAFMERRREIAQEWADMLLEGMPSASELLEGPPRRTPPHGKPSAAQEGL